MEILHSFKDRSKVEKIRFKNNRVYVSFSYGDLILHPETYSKNGIEVGNIYSKSELNDIRKEDDLKMIIEYTTKLEEDRLFTEFQIREKVFKKFKSFPYHTIKEGMKILKDSSLIDDQDYCQEYYEIMSRKNYGWNRIIEDLFNKKFADGKAIESLAYDKEYELQKAQSYFDGIKEKYEKLDALTIYKKIYNQLVSRGFKIDIVNEVLANNNVNLVF